MKYLTLFGALVLTASPVVADDYLYLRCKSSIDWVTKNSTTSKTTENRTLDDIALLKVDFKKKTILDTRSDGPLDIAIQDKVLTITQRIDDKEMKLQDIGTIELTPPYAFSGKGTGIYKSKNETSAYSYEGLCKEINESVFEKALKESES